MPGGVARGLVRHSTRLRGRACAWRCSTALSAMHICAHACRSRRQTSYTIPYVHCVDLCPRPWSHPCAHEDRRPARAEAEDPLGLPLPRGRGGRLAPKTRRYIERTAAAHPRAARGRAAAPGRLCAARRVSPPGRLRAARRA